MDEEFKKRHYPPEPRLADKPASKSKAVAPSILDNHHYAEAATIMRTLENGLDAIEREADALRIERHLNIEERRGGGRAKQRNSRNTDLQARLDKHRTKVPAEKADEPAHGKLRPTVAEALEIIRGSRPATRVDPNALIAQLDADGAVVRKAIMMQQAAVDELRNELSGEMARRLVPDHRKRVLAQFRAAQDFAAATDAEAEFRKSVIDAGYTWRADLLEGPQLRAALVLGSESTFDSDISRARRMLEELKIL